MKKQEVDHILARMLDSFDNVSDLNITVGKPFQVESSGMRRYLKEMKPSRLEHVIAMVALYRPGPMDFIPDYIDRMHGRQRHRVMPGAIAPLVRNDLRSQHRWHS